MTYKIEMNHPARRTGSQRRLLAAALAAALLPGCSLVNTDSAFWATAAAILPQQSKAPVTREHAEALPYASMLAWFDDTPMAFLVLGEIRNGEDLIWYSAARQIVVTQGPFLIQTGGMPVDLTSVRFESGIPSLLTAESSERTIDLTKLREVGQRLAASYSRGGQETVTILDRSYELTRVTETVRFPDGKTVENLFWVDAQTGFVWKSKQHIHPSMPALNIEILKPASLPAS